MKATGWIDLGRPAVLEFSGPDAVRFLNGQVTQDVRRVMGTGRCLWSCVTDAKGRLQFRVQLMESAAGVVRVVAPEGQGEASEARLTRYLIADDVEVVDRSGAFRLVHWLGGIAERPAGVEWREFERFGVAGADGWISEDGGIAMPGEAMIWDEVETLRISSGIPAWGSELVEGMLPPEAALEATDIAYDKGCYIGQEVISRIKSAGKVNRMLRQFEVGAEAMVRVGEVTAADGRKLGEITSIAPLERDGKRAVLGYVKRGVELADVVVAVEGGA